MPLMAPQSNTVQPPSNHEHFAFGEQYSLSNTGLSHSSIKIPLKAHTKATKRYVIYRTLLKLDENVLATKV